MPEFLLSKWYLDYVSPNFNCSIIYKGGLRYGPFEVHHCSELNCTDGIIFSEIFWDNRKYEINELDDYIECKLKNRTLFWNPLLQPITLNLYKKDDKYINWRCAQPLARVEGTRLSGEQYVFGYAEQLETNILPWEFEFDTLLWGRFTSPLFSVIWTSMDGKYSKKILLVQGKEVEPLNIAENEVTFANGSLAIQNIRTLREGNLMTTLLTNMPFLKQVLPKTGFPLYEKKLLAKGTLRVNDTLHEGQIIHEVVKWK